MIVYNTENGTIGTGFRSILEMSDGTIAAAENTGIDFIKNGEAVSSIGENDDLSTPLVLSLLELPFFIQSAKKSRVLLRL